MYLPAIAFVTLAAAAPASILVRTPANDAAAPSCNTPGQLLCNGQNQWGLCTVANSIVWMATADGTSCDCSAGDCSIVNDDDLSAPSSSPSGNTSTSTSAPAPTQTSPPAYSTPASPPANSTLTSPPPYSGPASTPSSAAAPLPSGTGSHYTQFNGDGSPQDGWPTMSDWIAFDDLFTAYEPIMGQTCTSAFGVPNTPASSLPVLQAALLSESQAAGIPPQFALAIMMQESLGCVFVDTTNNGVVNPGLFQDHDGNATCYQQPTCPPAEIQAMVQQGVSGTSSGAGLQQCATQAPGTGAQRFYQAARIYNSGSLPAGGNLGDALGSTSCYASDIANRLIGWTSGVSQCTL